MKLKPRPQVRYAPVKPKTTYQLRQQFLGAVRVVQR